MNRIQVAKTMWRSIKTEKFVRRYKDYSKKKTRQLSQVIDNLDLFELHVRAGGRVKPFEFPFLHAEPMDVVAIDQSGGGKLAETRLYVWVDSTSKIIHLITLGDKKTQHEDIQFCKSYVKVVKANPDSFRDEEEDDEEGACEGGG